MAVLEAVGFRAERHERSVNLHRRSHVSLRLSAEDLYRETTSRAIHAALVPREHAT